ncbi:MAG TPA: DUF748 domain-containing protein [Alphaproteobacteria bacterium]|nr:DUF748 domain-containing protein [Alphaproteobacteria bacterium]
MRTLELEHAVVEVERPGDVWRIGGLPLAPALPAEGSDASDWQWGLQQLRLRDLTLRFELPDFVTHLRVDSADLTRLATWNAAQEETRARLQGRIDDAPVTIEATLRPFADQPGGVFAVSVEELPLQSWRPWFGDRVLTLDGTLRAHLQVDVALRDVVLHVAPQGEWSISSLHLATATQEFQVASLSWTGESELTRTGAGVQLHDAGSYRANGLVGHIRAGAEASAEGPTADHDLHLSAETAGWEGEIVLEERSLGTPAVRADGALTTGALRAEGGAAALVFASTAGRWQGGLRYGMQDVPRGYEITGALELREPRVTTTRGDLLLAASDALRLDGIDAKGTYRLAADELVLERWRLLARGEGDTPAVAHGATARARPIAVDDLRHVRTGTIELQEVDALLRRQADGGWYLLDQARALLPGDVRTAEPAGGLRVDRLEVSAGSVLTVEDQSVSPAYSSSLQIERLLVEELDRSQPHRASPFVLDARLDRHTPLRVKGELMPFAATADAVMDVRIDALELSPLSPYAVAALGYRIDSGQLDGTMGLKIIERQLRGEADVRLRNLKVDAVREQDAAQLEKELEMPLEAALAMLRDKRGDVRLQVPIRGDLDNPQFRLTKVIREGLANTMRGTIVTTLKLTLQPFGAIVMATELAQEVAGAVRLEPVDFVAGSAHLSPVARQYMDRLAALLGERPGMRIRICGIATPADRQGLGQGGTVTEDALLELARQRAEGIKDALAREHGVAPERLFLCSPRMDEGVPRAELAL